MNLGVIEDMVYERSKEMDRGSGIAAGIVLYNVDDTRRTTECLKSVLEQVERVYVFDNSTEEYKYNIPDNVIYITENRNCGIAYALNRIMEKAEAEGYSWVITMDQDSILPAGIVATYANVIGECDESVGIICPQVIDSRRAYMKLKTEPEREYVDFCITSASCTSIDIWRRIGKFDEWLFIDLVDNEFCKRLICSKYKILRINSVVLNQEFGKIIPKSPLKQKFWIRLSEVFRNQNIAKLSYYKYVSPMRVYYTNRNIIYVNRKMRKYGPTAYENYNCKGYLGFLICFCVPSFLRAQSKGKVLCAIIRGMRDGRAFKVQEWLP